MPVPVTCPWWKCLGTWRRPSPDSRRSCGRHSESRMGPRSTTSRLQPGHRLIGTGESARAGQPASLFRVPVVRGTTDIGCIGPPARTGLPHSDPISGDESRCFEVHNHPTAAAPSAGVTRVPSRAANGMLDPRSQARPVGLLKSTATLKGANEGNSPQVASRFSPPTRFA